MKTINNFAKTLLIVALFAVGSNAFGQGLEENIPTEKYRVKVVRDDDGKKEVLDQTFTSKAEMEAYMKDHNIEVRNLSDKDGERIIKDFDKKCDKKEMSRCTKVVVEKEEKVMNKKAKNSGKKEESINNIILIEKGDKAELTRVMDETMLAVATGPEEESGNNLPDPVASTQAVEPMLSELSLYPNPTGGNFHLSFRTEKPADVTLRMTDIEGKQVYFNIIRNQDGLFEKDIFFAAGLPKGTYLLEAKTGDQRITTRVVVQ